MDCSTLISIVIGVIAGGIITGVVSYYFYIRAAKDIIVLSSIFARFLENQNIEGLSFNWDKDRKMITGINLPKSANFKVGVGFSVEIKKIPKDSNENTKS
ncbi:hypothetical protein [Pelotomaculum propionicicum]|uniref:Uncharacterized protein n=1 Tax=Pelotomaculum propionicicum TaxID=258475 RepID=A0A4Y7RXD3_9FIRM|nr:hypothetical protein [Pelotomaculum propionicicum]TEB13379.1 hypothetical protein Pmgp_00273 [Pelotomaculum propionicicum]